MSAEALDGKAEHGGYRYALMAATRAREALLSPTGRSRGWILDQAEATWRELPVDRETYFAGMAYGLTVLRRWGHLGPERVAQLLTIAMAGALPYLETEGTGSRRLPAPIPPGRPRPGPIPETTVTLTTGCLTVPPPTSTAPDDLVDAADGHRDRADDLRDPADDLHDAAPWGDALRPTDTALVPVGRPDARGAAEDPTPEAMLRPAASLRSVPVDQPAGHRPSWEWIRRLSPCLDQPGVRLSVHRRILPPVPQVAESLCRTDLVATNHLDIVDALASPHHPEPPPPDATLRPATLADAEAATLARRAITQRAELAVAQLRVNRSLRLPPGTEASEWDLQIRTVGDTVHTIASYTPGPGSHHAAPRPRALRVDPDRRNADWLRARRWELS